MTLIRISDPKEDDKSTLRFPVWDVAVLPRLLGDKPAFHRQLLEKFLIDAQKHVTTILSSAMANDMIKISQTAHSLKSLARTIGAMQLGELSQELELIGKSTNTDGCQLLVDGLQAAFDQCAVEIKQDLSKHQLAG